MKRVTFTAFMVCAAWLSFGQTARFGDLNRNSVVVTSAPPQSVVSVNGQTGAVEITAEQIGALTNETDEAALAALAAYAAYWPPNATASSWFTFVTNSGSITITGYNIGGGTDVVIPDYIHGLPVTEIGANAFTESGVTSIGGAGNVVTVGASAFEFCTSLASVSLPQVQTVGAYAFYGCTSLASVSLPQVQTVGAYAFEFCGGLTSLYFDNDAPTIGIGIFENITPNQVTNYVTNPTATGWGATFAGMPVVRLPLYADAIYQSGELVATTGHVAQASLADADGYTTQMVMRVGSEITTNRWGPRVTLPDGIVTNGMVGPITFVSSNSLGLVVSGQGSAGGPVDTEGGAAIGLVYNAEGNRQLWFGSSERGTGVRFIGGSVDAWDMAGNRDGQLMVGGSTYQLWIQHGFHSVGDSGVVGNFVSSGTNTAAEVRTLGGYSIFDSGSNCYWRVTASNGTFYASDTNGVRKFKFTTETP